MRSLRMRSPGGYAPADGKEFEDVLFGTIGVVLLLLVVALAMIGLPEVSKEQLEAMARELAAGRAAENQARQEQARAEQEKQALREQLSASNAAHEAAHEEARRELQEEARRRQQAERDAAVAEKAKSDLEPHPTDAVLAIDGTLSMGPVLLAAQKSVLSLAEIGSRLAPRFRLGIVVYRGQGFVDTFPLTEIGKTRGGRLSTGMISLKAFMETKDKRVGIANFEPGSEVGKSTGKFNMATRMSALSGYADVEGGVREALTMLNASGGGGGTRSVLLLVGDVGVHEGGQNPEVIEPSDTESAARIRGMVRDFVNSRDQTSVWSVFSGDDVEHLKLRSETIAFFRGVAGAAGEKGSYTDDLSSLTAATVEAVFGKLQGGG